jgi:hypothetical protein
MNHRTVQRQITMKQNRLPRLFFRSIIIAKLTHPFKKKTAGTSSEEISNKLVAEGIVKRAHLPSTENMDRWDMVKEDCGLNEGELCELMNILFPVGK